MTGCSDAASFTIEADIVRIYGTVGYDDCTDGTGFITLEIGGDPDNYTYSWTNGATTKDIDQLAFGAYRVTVTHKELDCSATRLFYLNNNDFITGSAWECTIVDDQTIFAKVSTVVWQGGTPPYTFNWSNGDSSTDDFVGSTTVSLPATLTVTITDANGCSSVSETITPDCGDGAATDFSTASSYHCVANTDNLALIKYRVWEGGIAPYTFTWSTGEEHTHSNESSILVTADEVTEYSVTVTDQTGKTHVSKPILPHCDISGDPVILDLGEASVESGRSVCVPITVQDFDNLLGLQFSISWDPSKLIGDSLTNLDLLNLTASNYSFSPMSQYASPGVLTFAWIDTGLEGQSLPDGSTLFEICFTAVGNSGDVELIFSNHPTLIEATNVLEQVIQVGGLPGKVEIQNASNTDRVWPGDTDKNNIVDHFDLLNIGLAFGSDGYPRPDANLIWQPQFAANWPQATPNTSINYKHIDTDGNSIINASDTLAMARNYGLFNYEWAGEDGYTDRANLPASARTTGTPLYVDTYAVAEGTSPVFDIMLGDDENTENTVYGLGFSINYDPLAVVPGSIKLSFEDSWIGQQGQNLLTFYRVDPQNHKVHVAITRTDGLDITGSGPIAQLLITIEDVIFRSTDYEIPISIENARLINVQEEAVPVLERTSTIAVGSTTNTIDPSIDSQIRVYPIPANETLFLKTPNLIIKAIELYSLEGKRLKQWQTQEAQLSIKDLATGTYAVRLITDQGVAVRRVVILKR